MDRISGANFTTIGGKRFFQDLNLAANQVGTDVVALWLNGGQESILAPVEDIGLVASDADNTQLLQAIKLYAGANLQTITASPTNPLTIQNAGTVLVNATAGNIAITLPAAAAANGKPFLYRFIRTDSSANTVSLALHAGDTTLFGALAGPFSLAVGGKLTMWSDGASHWVVENSARGMQAFTASGTFVVPVWISTIEAMVWGSGGGGGGCAAGSAGSGGTGGGFSWGVFSVTPGASIAVTVAAGGTAGASGGGNGGNGGSSSLGALCTATGGAGGFGAASSGVIASQQPSVGTGSGGQFNYSSGAAAPGYLLGPTYLGSPGTASFASSPTVMSAGGGGGGGLFPGGGGGGVGATAATAGGAGAGGLVLVRW